MSFPVPLFALGIVVGFVLGVIHFASLKRVTALYLGKGPVWRAIGLQVLRLTVLTVALILMARQGAVPLFAAFVGLLLARTLVLRRAKMEA